MLLRENFSETHIRNLQNISRRDPALLERTVYAFGLLEAERAELFPIILCEYNPNWPLWYAEEKERLIRLIGNDSVVRISHIGSTAVPGLTAKPTIDILLEIAKSANLEKLIVSVPDDEYICLRDQTIPTNDLALFLKGYNVSGFAERVFHIHVRYPGDWDEVHFRDYLLAHPEAAETYGKLKRELKDKHEHDRDGYTDAKGEFIEAVTKRARGIAEKMDDFFVARLDIYEDNMLHNVEGLPEGYFELAKYIVPGTKTLLDLGCGTGLELDQIFRLYPYIEVTGIDLTKPMLEVLADKFGNKNITLICASYLGYDFGYEQYDCVISFETMHHWTKNQKTETYRYIHKALKPGGRYIECDYMLETQSEEDHFYCENLRIREEQNIPYSELCHIDIPFAIDTQIKLLTQSGFASTEMVWRKGETSIIVANK